LKARRFLERAKREARVATLADALNEDVGFGKTHGLNLFRDIADDMLAA